MLVHMSSTNITINILLEEALNEPDIGTTSRFRWHATAVGIADFGLTALRHQPRPLRTHSKKGSMLGSTSAGRNENFIKWSRGWFCCFIHKNSSEIPSKNPIYKLEAQALAISHKRPWFINS